MDNRSLALGDGLTVESVKMGGRTARLSAEGVFGAFVEAILLNRDVPNRIEWTMKVHGSREVNKGYGEGSFSRVA